MYTNNTKEVVFATLAGALLLAALTMPILIGGTANPLFWALLGVYALGIVVTLTLYIITRRQQR